MLLLIDVGSIELDEIPGLEEVSLVELTTEELDTVEVLDTVEALDTLEELDTVEVLDLLEELLEIPNVPGTYIAISLLHGLYFIDIDYPFSFLNITHYIYGLVI
jgi:hypothetical protein